MERRPSTHPPRQVQPGARSVYRSCRRMSSVRERCYRESAFTRSGSRACSRDPSKSSFAWASGGTWGHFRWSAAHSGPWSAPCGLPNAALVNVKSQMRWPYGAATRTELDAGHPAEINGSEVGFRAIAFHPYVTVRLSTCQILIMSSPLVAEHRFGTKPNVITRSQRAGSYRHSSQRVCPTAVTVHCRVAPGTHRTKG
jgi:hypothetical protein